VIDEITVQRAVEALLKAAPGSRVILFGSYARGDARPDSDLDFLVVEPEVKDRFREMVRLSRILGEIMIPADVVVVSEKAFNLWRNTPNTLIHHAVEQGRAYEKVA